MSLVSLPSRSHLVPLCAGHAVLTSVAGCRSSRSRRQRASLSRPRSRYEKAGRTGSIHLGGLQCQTVPERPDNPLQIIHFRAASFTATTTPRQTPLSPSL